MFLRLLLPTLLGASSAFACASSTRCLAEVQARPFTLVQGEIDAVLVQEYALANGCIEVTVDSIVRRAPELVLEPVPKPAVLRWGSSEGSAAVTVFARWTSPKLDTAQAALCAKVRIERHVDSIPRSNTTYPGPADEPLSKLVPVNPDSVHLCLNGDCGRIVPRRVQNLSKAAQCIPWPRRRFNTPFEARDFLLGTFANFPLKPRVLNRLVVMPLRADIPYGSCAAPVADAAVDLQPRGISIPDPGPDTLLWEPPIAPQETVSTDQRFWIMPEVATVYRPGHVESRFSFLGPYLPDIDPLESWKDSSVPPQLALPSSANAGDLFEPETLRFRVEPLDGTSEPYWVRYATGTLQYAYLGDRQEHILCGSSHYASRPRLIGDTLRLKGLGLLLTNRATCPVAGQDVFATQYDRWLYLPSEDGPFQSDFTHTNAAENAQSWPMVGDTVLVGDQKVPLAWLQSNVSIGPFARRGTPFAVRRSGNDLLVTLEREAEVKLATATGRILSSRVQPQGTSRLALPRGHRGILLVQAEGRSVRVLAP